MSKTYRFLKVKNVCSQLGISSYIYSSWKDRKNNIFHNSKINPFSQKGKKKLAMIFSDKKEGVMLLNGPSWFHNQFSQRPHRAKSIQEINKFIKSYMSTKDQEQLYEVIIENKPKRKYWY